MRIWLSKRNAETGKRHLVLDMNRDEERDAFWVLRREVLQNGRAPKRRLMNDGTVRYRFSRQHLDRLMMAFPFAEVSPGLDRRIHNAEAVELGEVPEIDIPDFNAKLWDFQKIGVQAILDNPLFMLNDEMGLGKTYQALAGAVKLLAVPVLVVCPNSAKWVWERVVKQTTDWEVAVVNGTRLERQEQIAKMADITVINFEALRLHPEMADIQYGMAIVDEFHRLKNPKAAMTKAFHTLSADRWLLMSGTPILNRPEEAWSGLHRLFPQRYSNYWQFERWLTIKGQGRFPKIVGYKPEAMRKLKEHMQDPTVSLRRRKDHVLRDLPQVVYNTVLIELNEEQRRLYRQIVDELRLAMEDGEITTLRGVLSMVTRAKQACFSPELYGGSKTSAKLDELKEIVRQLVDNGEKAIVFSQWSKATRIIQRELAEYNPAYVDGSVRGDRRMAEVDKFNNDEACSVYIGTIGANREAITLSAATYVIFTDKDWTPMNNDQAIGRSAAGGLRGVGHDSETRINVIELFAHDTIEERIEVLLTSKRSLFNALIERDGGAAITRTTIHEIGELF